MKILCVIFATLLLAAGGQALASDGGIYLGAAATDIDGSYEFDLPWRQRGDPGVRYKLIGGIRPLSWLAVEANYLDLGEVSGNYEIACAAIVGNGCPAGATIDSREASVSALAFMTLPAAELYVRVGAGYWKWERINIVNSQPGQTFTPTDDSGTGAVAGVGAQYHLGSLRLRAEYEHVNQSRQSANLLSIGLTYTFAP